MEQEQISEPANEEGSETDEFNRTAPSPWLAIILAILVSGLVGFLIGRQTAGAGTAEQSVGGEATEVAAVVDTVIEDAPDPVPAAPTPAPIASETLTTMGDPDAPVTIVEFSEAFW